MDNKSKILIFFPFALAVILAVAANYIRIPFNSGLSETDLRISAFAPTGPAIKEKQSINTNQDIKSLLDFNYTTAAETPLPENNSTPHDNFDGKGLSLIIISGGSRTAIIKGSPVKEGDKIADMKIVKIEHDKVLLKDKTLKWMYLE